MLKLTDPMKKSDAIGYYDLPPMVQKRSICWGLGPLEVCASIVSVDRIDIEIKLAGITIATGSLTVGNSQICAGANAGLVKASVCVTADFPAKTVWLEGDVCTRRWDGGWDCQGFKTILASW